ncbi:MAG TPA: cytochrome c biogenesis protein CcdA, partial [Gaiellaceae bacterium]|nr:cytochrome c biogenesis protein CcdA [Gaiellaceae bacterium]
MLLLLGIGFVAGAITAISPCVLPVLPILLAGGASGGERRPYAIVAGLVASFTFFTLAAAWLLDALGLPQDVLRNLAIALLFLVAATLIFPSVAHWVERPFYPLTRLRPGDVGGGLLLGASLGLVFVPCAGPVLAAVAVLAAGREVDGEVVLLTLAYALGAALPMLAIALFGRRAADALRPRVHWLRPALGAVVGLT